MPKNVVMASCILQVEFGDRMMKVGIGCWQGESGTCSSVRPCPHGLRTLLVYGPRHRFGIANDALQLESGDARERNRDRHKVAS